MEKVDWVFVTTKAYAATETAQWFKHLRREDTPVAILQNGVEHRERFSSFLPDEWIVPVMVDCPAERISPTQIRQRGPAKLVAQLDELGQRFTALFDQTGIAVSLTPDLRSTLWKKLCTNAAGVISAILSQPAGVMRDEAIGEAARQIVRECIEVGRAEGAVLEDAIVETVINSYRNAPADSINSLHADRIAGRPMEIDARNGVIARLGKKHQIATPCNQMAVALLQAIAKTGSAS